MDRKTAALKFICVEFIDDIEDHSLYRWAKLKTDLGS